MEENIDPNASNYNEYLQCKGEWENIQKIKMDGIIMRLKAKWIEEGEQNTNYFLSLEKRNYNTSYIRKLIDKDENEITSQEGIIDQQYKFYNKLYTTEINGNIDTRFNDFLKKEDIPQLNDSDKEICESVLMLEECAKALQKLPNNKSSGSDGFTTNFYILFWPDIKNVLHKSFHYSFEPKALT